MSSTDLELLGRYVNRRDAEAFAALVARHRDMVYSVCYRVLGSRADAEDSAQECFVDLARSAASIKSSVAGWLHRVAVRGSLTMRRRDRARKATEREAASIAPGRAAEPAWDDIKADVDRAIDDLPDSLREPLVRHFLEDQPQMAIARELGVSQPAVSKRIKRAVDRLRRHLKECGITVSAGTLAMLLSSHGSEAASATLIAELGKIAVAGIGSSPVPTGTTGAAAGHAALVASKTKIVCLLAGALAAGIALHQTVRGPAGASQSVATSQRAEASALSETHEAGGIPPTASPTRLELAPPAQPLPHTLVPIAQAADPAETRTVQQPPGQTSAAVTVTGQVLDPQGTPVGNAELWLMHRGAPPKWYEVVTGRADEEGGFTLQYTPREQSGEEVFQLWALAEGYGLGMGFGTPAWPDVTVRLTEPAAISGAVRNVRGEPVAGARVRLAHLWYPSQGRVLRRRFPLPEPRFDSHTDGNGRFRIDQVPKGAGTRLAIEAEGYAWNLVGAEAGESDVSVCLTRGGMVVGRVLHDGRPVADVRVVADAIGRGAARGETTSARDGSYEVGGLSPALYNVMIDPPTGLTATAHEGVEVKAGETTRDVDFRLTEGGIVRGTVRDPDTGDAFPGVRVYARGPGRPESTVHKHMDETDRQGRYELRLPAGRNVVLIVHGPGTCACGDVEPARRVVEVAEGETTAGVDFTAKRNPLLRRQVLDPDGQPVPGAQIWSGGSGELTERADDQGRFPMFATPWWNLGTVHVTSPDESLGALFQVTPESETTELRLQPVARIVARIQDPAGRPVEGVWVRCEPKWEAEIQGLWEVSQPRWAAAVSDAEGKAELLNVPAGAELEVRPDTPGFDGTSLQPKKLTLQPGETRDINAFTVDPGGQAVSGLVHDADRHALAGRAFVVELNTGRATISDDQGCFELTRLRLDRATLLLAHDSDERLYGVREVPPEDAAVSILLKPLASAEGVLLDSELQPAAGVWMVADMEEAQYSWIALAGRRHLPAPPVGRTDEDGFYRIDNLLDGVSYRVHPQPVLLRRISEVVTAQGGAVVRVPEMMLPPELWPTN